VACTRAATTSLHGQVGRSADAEACRASRNVYVSHLAGAHSAKKGARIHTQAPVSVECHGEPERIMMLSTARKSSLRLGGGGLISHCASEADGRFVSGQTLLIGVVRVLLGLSAMRTVVRVLPGLSAMRTSMGDFDSARCHTTRCH
jgi:hypothetical protein